MTLRPASPYLRFMLGGLAASLGLAGAASATVATPAAADPVEGSGPTQSESTLPPGTYVSCTAYFGLTKYSESDLASYAVDVVDDAVTPEPVIGTDLVPVLTVTDASDETVECTPDLAWTDETSWGSSYFSSSALAEMIGLVTYPGPGYYLIPATFGFSYTTPDTTTFTPVSTSIRFENTYTNKVITVVPTAVPPTADGVFAPGVELADLDNSYFTDLFDAVETTGNAAQRAYFEQWWADRLDLVTCSDSDPLYASTAVTLQTLVPGVAITGCDDFYGSSKAFYEAAQFNAKIAASLITITIADPPPPTTTTTTTTTTTVQPDPVIPAFAG